MCMDCIPFPMFVRRWLQNNLPLLCVSNSSEAETDSLHLKGSRWTILRSCGGRSVDPGSLS